jgi:tellurite resistance protein
MDDELPTTDARQMLFLAAAWIANVDGEEHEAEIDALCQLRSALGLAPDLARKLHQIARDANGSRTASVRP